MTKQISIHGIEVTISTPYEAGHTITEAEAKALNQTRAENIANNFRARIKAAKEGAEGAESLDKVLSDLTTYDGSYTFSLAAAGGSRSSLTPLEKETRRVAKNWLLAKLKGMGKTLKSYTEEKSADAVESKILEIAATEGIIAEAKKNLANAAKSADAVAVEV